MKDETGMTACKNGNLALRTDEEGLARDERKGPGRRWAITGSAGSGFRQRRREKFIYNNIINADVSTEAWGVCGKMHRV